MRFRLTVAALSCVLLVGCSSDAANEPEPTVEDLGAFVAVGTDRTTHLSLFRTLNTLRISGDTALFWTWYDVDPTSFEEAREIAKRQDLPIRKLVEVVSERQLMSTPHRVVWFRTLTREERARAP